MLNQSQADSVFDYVPLAKAEQSKRILVVDDSDFLRMVLDDIFTQHGHTVLQAKNGQECIDVLRKETVDVCVLDIGMPVMDGIDALKIIKEEWPEQKVVMLSALAKKSNVEKALQLGADAFVVKPFQAECLLERIS